MAAGIALVVAAVLVAYVFDETLPGDATFWGTLGLCAMALGSFLAGGATLAAARKGDLS